MHPKFSPYLPPHCQAGPLTHITGAGEEIYHEGGLGQVGEDGVMHHHQHLLVEAEGQLRRQGRSGAASPPPPGQGHPAPPGPTLCLRKLSHMAWKAFLCS